MLPAMEAFANRFGKKGLTNIQEGFNPQTSVREFWRILKDLRKGEGKDTFVSLRNGVNPEKLGFFKRMRETLSYAWHRFRTGAKKAFKREQQAVTEGPQQATMPTLDDIAAQPKALTAGKKTPPNIRRSNWNPSDFPKKPLLNYGTTAPILRHWINAPLH